jgi:hypothetical protein
MIINDHILKDSSLIHHTLTGKLSDFAFLFLALIVGAYIFRVKTAHA